MGKPAFLIAGDRAAVIANDNCDFRYSAAVHYLPVGVQVPLRSNGTAETQFLVDDGVVEFMIGGIGGIVLAGDFVRIPQGVPYAYRNAGDATARILVRTTSPAAARRVAKLNAGFAA
jgi:mannose-6-phosphate isomerase-like protein (cupin superfamily)